MRWAIWSVSALFLAGLSFEAGRFGLFHPLPEIAAALPGDKSLFSREFDGRIREPESSTSPTPGAICAAADATPSASQPGPRGIAPNARASQTSGQSGLRAANRSL